MINRTWFGMLMHQHSTALPRSPAVFHASILPDIDAVVPTDAFAAKLMCAACE